MKKKVLLSLAFVCIGILTFGMSEVSAAEYGDLSYSISNGGITITDCKESAEEVVIPKTIDNRPVTSIGGYAFYNCKNIKRIDIPDSITRIDAGAFRYCSSLAAVVIPNSVTYIGQEAFYGNSKTDVYISDLEKWCGITFANYSANPLNNSGNLYINERLVTDAEIPDNLTKINDYAFYKCNSIESVTIPDSITNIGNQAFYNCGNLKKVFITDFEKWCKIDFSDNASNPLCNSADLYLNDSLVTDIAIPKNITAVKDHTFCGCTSITGLTIHNNVERIGNYAFRGCINLKGVTIPDSVTSIGDFAFARCSFESIVIPDNVTSIGKNVFGGCADLTSVTVGNGITQISDNAFYNCENLKDVTLPKGLKGLGVSAFDGCKSLTEITLPYGLTDIGDYAFYYCNRLKSINIPDSVTSIGKVAFASCESLTSITLPKGVTTIKTSMFSNCTGLTEFTVPSGVTDISDTAFYSCTGLTSITIPDSVTNIGGYAFSGCSKLSTVYYSGSQQAWDKIKIGNSNDYLKKAQKIFSLYVTLIDETGQEISKKKYSAGAYIDISDIEERAEHTIHLYTDKAFQSRFDLKTPVTESLILYLRYEPNKYKAKFINDDGTLISEKLVDYGAVILPPENPVKARTDKYTYAFVGWDGFYDGITQTNGDMVFTARYSAVINQYKAKFMNDDGTLISEKLVDYGAVILPPENPVKARTDKYTYAFVGWDGFYDGITQTNGDMVFTARYNSAINQYTYKFIDKDGTILKEETTDYGTVITKPDTPGDKDPYTFDYWENYSDEMTLTDNTEFKAVYKYKTYTITIKGLEKQLDVVYNEAFEAETQIPETEYVFDGYFTEENGNGIRVTDKNGKSLENYGFPQNITLYPYFTHELLNKIKIDGESSTVVGSADVVKKVCFATDKEASYLICNIRYPESISLKEIVPRDFRYVSEESRTAIGGVVYLSLICQYTNNLENLPVNKKIEPFELVFDIPKDISPQNALIEITSDSALVGEKDYAFDSIIDGKFAIAAKLVESIEIIGDDTVILENGAVPYFAEITPDYATDKDVVWSVDNAEIAEISQDGVLTPLKSGKVIITATAKDGSGVFAVKALNILESAKINALVSNIGMWDKEFSPAVREYTVYVPKNTKELSLKADFAVGTLKINNGTTTATMIRNRSKSIQLDKDTTTVTLLSGNQTDCADSEYKITIVKFEGINAEVSDDGKIFSVKPVNIPNESVIILALYDGDKFVEMKSEPYDTEITFTTDKFYTNARIMAWDGLGSIIPVCESNFIK